MMSNFQSKYLLAAFSIALTVHALGIWWIHTLKLDNTFTSEWYSEIGLDHPVLEQEDNEELIFKRNDQLAEAFQKLKEIPSQELIEGHDEIEMLAIEFTDLKFQETSDGPLLSDLESNQVQDIAGSPDFLNPEADPEALKESGTLLTQTLDPSLNLSPSEFNPSVVELLQPDHRQITQELIRVTELVPIHPLFTPFDKLAIGEAARNVGLDAPLLSGTLTAKGLEKELEGRLTASSNLPEGIRATAQTTRQTANLFLPQANKKLKAEETTCALPKANPDLVNRQPKTPETAISNDQFQVKVESAPRKNGEGYLFRLQIQPLAKGLPQLHRNIYFLIDRSSSISPQRYELSKAVVADALRYMKEGDTFNILILDNQITLLAQNNVPWNTQQVENALRFLNSQPFNPSTSSVNDLYTTLSTIVPQEAEPNEINLAILLSDGGTQLNREHQKRFVTKWTQRNSGKLALFSVALPTSKHLGLLEVLSTFNHGKMYISPSAAAMSKTVAGLVQALQPLGKDLTISAVPQSKQTVVLSPPNSRVTALFEKAPLVLYGSSDRELDFYLFIQGKTQGQRLDLKQKVLISGATKGDGSALEKAWALHNAQVYYERFMRDGDVQHLQLARQLLEPYHMPLAFY